MLTGKSLIAGEPLDSPDGNFTASGTAGVFEEASAVHVDRALTAADGAWREYRQISPGRRAEFLDWISESIERAGDLLEVASVETSLPLERLRGERARTAGQLRLFASVVRDGSW